MDKKKILIVCKAFYPENSPRSFRATELAKEFSRQGHEVTVLTQERDFDYSEFLKEYKINLKSYGKLTFKHLTRSDWKLVGDWKRKFGRLLYMLANYPEIEIMGKLKKALKSEGGYDLMVSVATPHPVHWGVAWARTENHPIARTWVADCGDPFMGLTLESFRFPLYFGYLEKWFCRKANYLTVPTEGAISAYYPEFHHKIKVIPQGFNFEEVELANSEIIHQVPTFAYAGGISSQGVRNPHKIIQYLLDKELDFQFHIYATNGHEFLKPYLERAPDQIILHEAKPRKSLLYELSKMDFLLNLDNGVSQQKPSKLIDYALTNRPILNVRGEAPDFELIDNFLKKDYTGRLEIPNINDFHIKKVTSGFLALLN